MSLLSWLATSVTACYPMLLYSQTTVKQGRPKAAQGTNMGPKLLGVFASIRCASGTLFPPGPHCRDMFADPAGQQNTPSTEACSHNHR